MLAFDFFEARTTIQPPLLLMQIMPWMITESFISNPKGKLMWKIAKRGLKDNKQEALKPWDVSEDATCHFSGGVDRDQWWIHWVKSFPITTAAEGIVSKRNSRRKWSLVRFLPVWFQDANERPQIQGEDCEYACFPETVPCSERTKTLESEFGSNLGFAPNPQWS